ncbi:MAG: hypothetical protein HY906_23395 [Deltaproteobacteria bacterium]|nr:hypothetical protein [Deltaproteobacteria bacterium]
MSARRADAPSATDTYPLDRTNQRRLAPDFAGPVVLCDIDKTYLATNFSSLRGLLAIPFEFAIDKRAITGMAPLLREVRRGPGSRSRLTPLYFVSASPPQLRKILQKKMLLDGVEFDGITFKDQLRILRLGGVRRLREHFSFKLTALLLYHADFPPGAREILIGDDTESDALCYTIFGDAVAGRLRGEALRKTLVRHGVGAPDAAAIAARVAGLEPRDSVARIYVHLEKRTPPEAFAGYGRLAASRDALQLALDLWSTGEIAAPGVVRVAAALHEAGRPLPDLVSSVLDARARGLVTGAAAAEAAAGLAAKHLWPAGLSLGVAEDPPAHTPREGLLTPAAMLG